MTGNSWKALRLWCCFERAKLKASLFVLLLLCCAAPTLGRAQTSVYQDGTTAAIAGTEAGDAYELSPCLRAEFLAKYVPGNPDIVIHNVPTVPANCLEVSHDVSQGR